MVLCLVNSAFLVATCIVACTGSKAESSSFRHFLKKHRRIYAEGSREVALREKLFNERTAAIDAQNAANGLWTAAVNHLTDWTDEELQTLRGWRGRHVGNEAFSLSDMGMATKVAELPQRIDWRNLTTAMRVPDQGPCGSCWAVTTAAVLDAHHEIYRGPLLHGFSAQELVSCVQNPRHCGGKGGCDGATVELGMEWAIRHGLSDLSAVPYEALDISCKKTMLLNAHNPGKAAAHQLVSPAEDGNMGGGAFGLIGFETLPSNKEYPLAHAVVQRGPVAVSASAAGWFWYKAGVFDSCPRDAVVDHAITLYGYGQYKSHKYWLIRNSWGANWGEKGFIRLLRHDHEEEYCGVDRDPQKGTGCEGGPSVVRVCGSCGILYDSVVPHFARKTEMATSPHSFSNELEIKGSEAQATASAATGRVAATVTAEGSPRFVRREAMAE